MKMRPALSLLAFTLTTMLGWSQQAPNQAPTLADIARQKRSEKAKKVYTSEDMLAAPPMVEPAAAEATTEAKPMVVKSTEAVAAAEAKVADLRDREIMLNKNIARFETSMATASAEGNEERVKSFSESLESAKTSLATTTQQRAAAEKELDDMKAAAAAAAATAKKPARKPAPKS